jgi:hypothetical protein
MSQSESDLMVAEKPLSPVQLFSAKVAVVTVAILVILMARANSSLFRSRANLPC